MVLTAYLGWLQRFGASRSDTFQPTTRNPYRGMTHLSCHQSLACGYDCRRTRHLHPQRRSPGCAYRRTCPCNVEKGGTHRLVRAFWSSCGRRRWGRERPALWFLRAANMSVSGRAKNSQTMSIEASVMLWLLASCGDSSWFYTTRQV